MSNKKGTPDMSDGNYILKEDKTRIVAKWMLLLVIVLIVGISFFLAFTGVKSYLKEINNKKDGVVNETPGEIVGGDDNANNYNQLPDVKPEPSSYLDFYTDYTLKVNFDGKDHNIYVFYYKDTVSRNYGTEVGTGDIIVTKEIFLDDIKVISETACNSKGITESEIDSLVKTDKSYFHYKNMSDKKNDDQYLAFFYKRIGYYNYSEGQVDLVNMTIFDSKGNSIGNYDVEKIGHKSWIYVDAKTAQGRTYSMENGRYVLFNNDENWHTNVELHDNYFYLFVDTACANDSYSPTYYVSKYEIVDGDIPTLTMDDSYDASDTNVIGGDGLYC